MTASMYELIDPPEPLAPKKVWLDFIASLERQKPMSAQAKREVRHAKAFLKLRDELAKPPTPKRAKRRAELAAAWRS